MIGPRIGLTFGSAAKRKLLSDVLAKVGACAVPLNVDSLRNGSLPSLDGLLLSGGADVHPALYGERPHAGSGPFDGERDQLEMRLLNYAQAEHVPVLGVCRGMQIINVFFGGTLNQQISYCSHHHERYSERIICAVHMVRFAQASHVANSAGTQVTMVNSRHHQCIRRLGINLRVVAWTDDGVSEAIEQESAPRMIGVQWHPEDMVRTHNVSRQLLRAFVKSASRF